MDARLSAMRWGLLVCGVLGLLCAVLMLLCALTQFGHSAVAASFPPWAQWAAAPPSRIPMLIVGALCALLLVAGPWPLRACAAAVAAWFIYAQAAYSSGSRLAEQVAQTFDYTPFWVASLVGVAALAALSVASVVLAVRPARAAKATHGLAAQPHP